MNLHLIHPAWVHLTLAFLVVGALVEAWGLTAGGDGTRRFGGRLFVIGAVSLPFTLLTGYLAANTVDPDPATLEVLNAHERNGWLLLGLLAVGLFWKAWGRGELPGWQRYGYALLLAATAALAVWSGTLGGEMVYFRGLGVAG